MIYVVVRALRMCAIRYCIRESDSEKCVWKDPEEGLTQLAKAWDGEGSSLILLWGIDYRTLDRRCRTLFCMIQLINWVSGSGSETAIHWATTILVQQWKILVI
jgi:hypothetical protein